MIQLRNLTLLSFLVFAIAIMPAQNAKIKKADRKYNDLAYIDAIEIYESVVCEGHGNSEIFQKLGNSHYFNANYVKAAQWYKKLFELEPQQQPAYDFKYGQSLKSIGDYEKANVHLGRFFKALKFEFKDVSELLDKQKKRDSRFSIKKTGFNTKFSNYPAFYTKNKLYIVSANTNNKKNSWNDEPSSDIFLLNPSSNLSPLPRPINTKYNEGSMVITKDGNTIYFTRNDYLNNKLGKDSLNITRLKLYKATKKNGKHYNVKELPFNNSNYSVGHPALSVDEKKLYFVSDMPGKGLGGTDIYEVDILANDDYGTPKNMIDLNTPSNETFPFVDTEGTFFFSSNGHPNLGGFDVFYSKPNSDGKYSIIQNIGQPINSPFDDFAFVIYADRGYFSSNREKSRSDNIYGVRKLKSLEEPCTVLLDGIVKARHTNKVLAKAKVSLIDLTNQITQTTLTNNQGKYIFSNIDCGNVKFIRIEKDKYLTTEEVLKYTNNNLHKEILLDYGTIPSKTGTNLNLLLNPIYFDYGKSFISYDSRVELEKVVTIMKQHPNIIIEIGTHTDSRSSAAFNLRLSSRRSKSVIDFLVGRGIPRNRLVGKSFGKSKPVNDCYNGKYCLEEKHRENRRAEFVIRNN